MPFGDGGRYPAFCKPAQVGSADLTFAESQLDFPAIRLAISVAPAWLARAIESRWPPSQPSLSPEAKGIFPAALTFFAAVSRAAIVVGGCRPICWNMSLL